MSAAEKLKESSVPKSFGPKTSSKRNDRFTLILIPNETGISKKFTLPKSLLYFVFVFGFCFVGVFTAMCLYVGKMAKLSNENEKLKAENHSIRSEATFLVTKLKQVQDNLTRVDKFSNQVFAEASKIDPKEAKSQKVKKSLSIMEKQQKKSTDSTKLPKKQGNTGIKALQIANSVGPLSAEEFAFASDPSHVAPMSHGADVKAGKLEFKGLFDQVQNIESESSEQATSLQSLLGELQAYRSKLAAAPTLAPVSGQVTSQYGWRVSPITGQNRMHQGLDIAAPLGSPIRAAAQGTILKVANAEDYGNYVELSHGLGVMSRYAHALMISVTVGQKVRKGDIIGKVGMTGRTTGPHLHYELEIGGRKVDPSGFLMSMDK
jgi:murein DD-endopeptidase MepM/ murein hydrolase activator NlpD